MFPVLDRQCGILTYSAGIAEMRDDPGEAGTSLFVEPLQWMQAELDNAAIQGKLYCPG